MVERHGRDRVGVRLERRGRHRAVGADAVQVRAVVAAARREAIGGGGGPRARVHAPAVGSDHGGGVLGGRDDVGALRVAVLDGRVGVALDLVVGVHRGVVLLVEVQRHLAVALVDEDGLHVAVVVVVGAHRRADGRGGSMTNVRGVIAAPRLLLRYWRSGVNADGRSAPCVRVARNVPPPIPHRG